MEYSQKELISLLKQGNVSGETTTPTHIETVISNVFIFPDTVYKVYKNDNPFFNTEFRDLAPKAARFDFTRRDFAWNHTLSPSVYLKLSGVQVQDGQVVFVAPNENADELVFVMNRIDSSDFLFEKLMRGEISKDEAFSMGEQFAQAFRRKHTGHIKGQNYPEIFRGRIADVDAWIKQVAEHIPEKESKEYTDFLEAFRARNQVVFEKHLGLELEHEGDMHSHNAIFSNQTLYLMDTFPPKEAWLVGHALVPLYRIGTDIWALSGDRDLFEAFIAGYEKESGKKVNRDLDAFFVIYASTIMVSYLYMLQRTDSAKLIAAKRFHEFVRTYYKSIPK